MSFTKNLVRQLAKDIVEYVNEKHAVDADRFDIQEILYIGLRDPLGVALEEYCEFIEDEDDEYEWD